MANDTWQGNYPDSWYTASDWSAGLPGANDDVIIDQGDPVVGTTPMGDSPFTVAAITIAGSAQLTFDDSVSCTVTGGVTDSGAIYFDSASGEGGSILTIDGELSNGSLLIGNAALSAESVMTVESVDNPLGGSIYIYGDDSPSHPHQAILDIKSAASLDGESDGVLSGSVTLGDDAVLEFASGQINTISGDLNMTGATAFVADAGSLTSNSALQGLTTNNGQLDVSDVDIQMTAAAGLTNTATFYVDQGGSGSNIAIAGALSNEGYASLYIGNPGMAASDMVSAASFSNSAQSTFIIAGTDTGGPTNYQAVLKIAGAASLGTGAGVVWGVGVVGRQPLIPHRRALRSSS